MTSTINRLSVAIPIDKADRTHTVTTSASMPVSSVSLDAAADFVVVAVQAEPIRVSFQGDDPTASEGDIWYPGDREPMGRDKYTAMRVIRDSTASGDATLYIEQFDDKAK